jgi:2-polyprenyl-3-methyl-5-hydroxy-6-metoxy-1,4-benzoquinol methylase
VFRAVKELPSLTEFARKFRSEHVVVVAISGDENARKYRRFLSDHSILLETYRDPARRISRRFGAHLFPETYLIQDGRIIRKVVGAIDWMNEDIASFVRGASPRTRPRIDGSAAYDRFLAWQKEDGNLNLEWESTLEKYRAKLRAEGLSESDAERTLDIISARDEASLYDRVYSNAPKFQTAPSSLLVEAVTGRRPGRALDVAMGQGRNAIYLAQQGWDVTGFDVSKVGLTEAIRLAASAGVKINAVLASDVEFDFGEEQWDLIGILYPIEKRSVYRVRRALKTGGIVVVECSHKEAANAPFEFETNELLHIFEGFRILKYEDAMGMHEWTRTELRLVRLIAQK